ncbi:hypothetical protein COLO4_12011 [Corchorus olitorius]|uniref:Uncharacterized protein n=1 Tax=Corchorus olitorius TaxID=93759 RepID=A0A1R3K2T7_9ROSI|nr:hypothetical protein COLO4_12011 [Corchorus olitorius]
MKDQVRGRNSQESRGLTLKRGVLHPYILLALALGTRHQKQCPKMQSQEELRMRSYNCEEEMNAEAGIEELSTQVFQLSGFTTPTRGVQHANVARGSNERTAEVEDAEEQIHPFQATLPCEVLPNIIVLSWLLALELYKEPIPIEQKFLVNLNIILKS